MTVGAVDHQHIDALFQQAADALKIPNTNGCSDAQSAPRILRRPRESKVLVDVLDRD